jgi:hypothetical protein
MSRFLSKSATRSAPRTHKVKPGDEVVGPDANFGEVLELVGDHALCLLEAPGKRLKLKKPLSLTQPQLERLNNESIRLGLRANIWENKVAALPRDQRFKIVRVFQHTDQDGHRTIRLDLLVGPNKDDMRACLLDVTADAWATIQKGR